MGGTQLALPRWAKDDGFYYPLIHGDVLELGPGYEPLSRFFYDRATSWTCIDHRLQAERYGSTWIEADASTHPTLPQTYDLIYSSHFLEHVNDPTSLLRYLWDYLNPNGHLWLILPSWKHYERCEWPPRRNSDHRTAWVLELADDGLKPLPFIRGLVNEVRALPGAHIRQALTLDAGWREDTGEDQTASGTCESSLEIVARKVCA